MRIVLNLMATFLAFCYMTASFAGQHTYPYGETASWFGHTGGFLLITYLIWTDNE